MNPISYGRVIRFGFQNFCRNIWLSVATVSVLVLTLISVNALLSMSALGKVALDLVKSKVDVSVHFRPDIEEARVQTVKISLLGLPEVRDVEYVSPAQSLERFSEMYKQDELVIETLGQVGENPFGSTLIVKARNIEGYPKILAALQDPVFASIIEEADFDDRGAMIGRIQDISDKIEAATMAASVVLGIIALLIVLNTIRMSIFTHRDEIRIMRLVGASNGFTRGPFYVEALIWSVIAVGATVALVYPALAFGQPLLRRFFGVETVDLLGFYQVNFLQIFGLQFAAVLLLSLLTAKFATAKYLRE